MGDADGVRVGQQLVRVQAVGEDLLAGDKRELCTRCVRIVQGGEVRQGQAHNQTVLQGVAGQDGILTAEQHKSAFFRVKAEICQRAGKILGVGGEGINESALQAFLCVDDVPGGVVLPHMDNFQHAVLVHIRFQRSTRGSRHHGGGTVLTLGEIKAPSAGRAYGDQDLEAVAAQDVEKGFHSNGVGIAVDIVVFLRHAEQDLIVQISVFIRDGVEEIDVGEGCAPFAGAGVGLDDAQMAPVASRSMICGVPEHKALQLVFLQFLRIIQERDQRRVVLSQGLVAEIEVPAERYGQGVGINFGGVREGSGVLLRRFRLCRGPVLFSVPLLLRREGYVLIGFGPEGGGQADGQNEARRRQDRRGNLPWAGGVRRLGDGFQLRVDLRPGFRRDVQNVREAVQLLPSGPGQIGLPFADGLAGDVQLLSQLLLGEAQVLPGLLDACSIGHMAVLLGC